MIDIRSEVFDSYTKTIENSFSSKQPQLKLINYGTGSGKTYQFFHAISKAIKKYPDTQIIGVYVAPLREHLQVEKDFSDVPSYRLNSLEMKTADELIRKYKGWIDEILRNTDFWKIDHKKYSYEEKQNLLEGTNNAKTRIRIAKDIINRLEYIKKNDFGDEDYQKTEIKRAIREINNCIEDFLTFVVNHEANEMAWPDECLELMEIFFPLHLLREQSGIVMLTYKKFTTRVPYFERGKRKRDRWVKSSSYLNEYIQLHSSPAKKFILAFDEQEDGYQIILKEKIDIISPQSLAINNALSSIYREFPILFSENYTENKKFLRLLEQEPNVCQEFEEHLENGKELSSSHKKYLPTYKRLSHTDGNSQIFLMHLVKIEKNFRNALQKISDVFAESNENRHVPLDFDMLIRTISIFESNRSFLISSKLYRTISHELMNIFSYNNLYVYNIEPLQQLFLLKSSGGHVHITEKKTAKKTSLGELIYALFTVQQMVGTINNFLKNVLDADDSQSRSLDVWSGQSNKLTKHIDKKEEDRQPLSKYLNRVYVYENFKSIINIMEIARYQHPSNNLINSNYREISIGSTTILTSPEQQLLSILEGKNNVIFLISATGGITADLSTSYDMTYLKDSLRNELGQSSFKAMAEKEIELCEKIRANRLNKRQISTFFFETDLSTFPNNATQKVVKRFEELVLNKFINTLKDDKGEKIWLSKYKVQELQNFIRFLFYLFEDEKLNETIAFTQTLRWIKDLLSYWKAQNHTNFLLTTSKEHQSIFYIELKHKCFASNCRIKLILYDASFNKNYTNKATKKTYLDELRTEEGQKIFFISAYQSAAKGLNPIINSHLKKEFQKDFDSLVLLMDSYYSVMSRPSKKTKEVEKVTTFQHFALMKNIVSQSGSAIEIKDFNQYLSKPEAVVFKRQQHEILLGKGILQAIGRTERREFDKQTIKIFINDESRKNLVNFYRFLEKEEPDEIRKFSVNNYEVYQSVQAYEKKRMIPNYEEHINNEIYAYEDFDNFRNKMLAEIQLFHQGKHTIKKIKQAWELLRNKIVFKDPKKYLEKLRTSKLFPDDFINALFYCPTDKLTFTPHIAFEEDEGKKVKIISDSIRGDREYPYLSKLYPDYLKMSSNTHDLEGYEIKSLDSSTTEIRKIHKKLLPNVAVFEKFIPRPAFFYDVLYPAFTEHFVEYWVHEVLYLSKDWKFIKRYYGLEVLSNFRKYKKLYEKFDLYYKKGETLFCIDVKAWSQLSGNRLSEETLNKTRNKLAAIAKDYPEFKEVKGLLLNLYAKEEKIQKHATNLFSGNLICFDHQQLPVASDILKDFLNNKLN